MAETVNVGNYSFTFNVTEPHQIDLSDPTDVMVKTFDGKLFLTTFLGKILQLKTMYCQNLTPLALVSFFLFVPKPFSLNHLLLLTMKFANRLAATCNRARTMFMMGPWFSKGLDLAKQSKYYEAIKTCDESIRLDPNHALAWYAKGIVLEALGRTSEAKAAKAKAKELGYKVAIIARSPSNIAARLITRD